MNDKKQEKINTREESPETVDRDSYNLYIEELKTRIKKLEGDVEYWQDLYRKIQDDYLSHTREVSFNLCKTIDHLVCIIEAYIKERGEGKEDKKTIKTFSSGMYRM
ncbi:MAG: hypothetical protein QXS02_04915 [Candidatus Thermoplasmatota archaeon]